MNKASNHSSESNAPELNPSVTPEAVNDENQAVIPAGFEEFDLDDIEVIESKVFA
jgi:hypothetical protein